MKLDNLLESLVKLDEGASVNSELDTLLKQNGYGDTAEVDNKMLRQALIQAVNALPVVWQSPNGQNSRTGKDALAIMAWFLSQWDGNRSTIQHTFEEVADLVAIKNSLKTTKGKWLADVQSKYKTVPEFRSFIQREQRNKNNTVEEVNVEGYDYPNPFYSDKDVDVYKASTINDAIKYSKGYTFCIGRRDGSNLFYGYRIAANAPESTVYFCWFKDAEGNKTHDDMCVIHVASNGKYRMTDARNSNGSPVVDKDTVLKEYPKLKKALEKMYSEPLDDEEKVVSKERPFTVIELNDTTRAYTPKQIAMLIGNACRFGDDFFNYVYEELDGKDLENGDSLIRKYLATGANRPTEEQEETLVQDGWGEYVEYNLKQYTKQVSETQDFNIQELKHSGSLKEFTRNGKVCYLLRHGAALHLYKPLDKPLLIDRGDVLFQGDLWDDDTLKSLEIEHTGYNEIPTFQFYRCSKLKTIDFSNKGLEIKLRLDYCYNVRSIKFDTISFAWINFCPAVNEIAMWVTASCSIYNNKAIKSFESFKNLNARGLILEGCSGLTSLKGIKTYASKDLRGVRTIEIIDSSNLSDVSELSKLHKNKLLRFKVTDCKSISKEDFIQYVIPMQRKIDPEKNPTTRELISDFKNINKAYPEQTDLYRIAGDEDVHTGFEINYVRPLDKPVVVQYCKLRTEESLKDLSGLYGCETLDIEDVYGLTDLRPFTNLKGINRIRIENCPNLISLEGCPEIESLSLRECDNIMDFSSYPNTIKEFTFDGLSIPQIPVTETDKMIIMFHKFKDGDLKGVPCKELELVFDHYRSKIYTKEPFKDFPRGVQKLQIEDQFTSFKGFTYDNVPREIVFYVDRRLNLDTMPLEDIFRVMDLRYPGGRNRICSVTVIGDEEADEELQKRYYEWAEKQHQHK